MNLTIHLYPQRFAEISFLDSMISKRELKESLFWIYEVYNSGFCKDCFELIYECYFYFYALHNPSFITVIQVELKNWEKTGDKYIIGKLVKNLYPKKYNLDVFTLHYYMNKDKTNTLKRYKKQEWEKKYGKNGMTLRYISKKDYRRAVKRIKNINQNEMEVFTNDVIRYFRDEVGIPTEKYKNLYQDISYDHPFIYLYVLYLIRIFELNIKSGEKKLKVSLSESEKNSIDEYSNHTMRNFKILKERREYGIACEFIGLFDTGLEDMNILEETRNNWREHAKDTPYWKDMGEEDDFEYDEQTKECQELSVLTSTEKKMEEIVERFIPRNDIL